MKTKRFTFRCTEEEFEIIAAAAKMRRLSTSSWLLMNAMEDVEIQLGAVRKTGEFLKKAMGK